MQFGAAADGAEYVDGYEYVGVGVFGRYDFDAAQVEDGLDEVGQEKETSRGLASRVSLR